MTIESNKNLGGVGSILVFISPLIAYVPGVGVFSGILALIGAILILIALKGFSDHYREAGVFNNALYAIIAIIVGGIAFAAVVFFAASEFFNALGLNVTNIQDWASLSSINFQSLDISLIFRFAGTVLLALVVLFAFLVITAVFFRKSLGLMATKTGVGLFGTTGLLLLIGAVLTIIAIGVFLVWIAILLLAVAFFSIRPQQTVPSPEQASV